MRIRVKNFQSLASVDIEAKGLTVIVGGSNLGKSALIRALEGCLFNKSGGTFVRTGAPFTSVEIEGLPDSTLSPVKLLHTVKWEKNSGGVNRFTLDGELIDKVGVNAPVLLSTWGYKDIDVDKVSIRPQIAPQFEGFFLLGKPGSFISDVLTLASRLSVLLLATDFCSTDLRKTKQLVGIRKSDLTSAEAEALPFKDVLPLHERVSVLGESIEKLRLGHEKFLTCSKIWDQLKRLKDLDSIDVPNVTIIPDFDEQVRKFEHVRQNLHLLAWIPELPVFETTDYLPIISQIAVIAELRSRLDFLSPLPVLKEYDEASRDLFVGNLEKMSTQTETWGNLISRYDASISAEFRAQAAATSTEQELEEIENTLSTEMTSLMVCPVCQKSIT